MESWRAKLDEGVERLFTPEKAVVSKCHIKDYINDVTGTKLMRHECVSNSH